MFEKLRRWLTQRGVLVRTLCYALTLVCIPLMLFSFTMTSNGKKDILHAWEAHSQSVAETAAAHFSQWADQMLLVSQDISSDSYLQEHRLNKTIYDDRQAIQTLKYYSNALPFADSCGLYLHQSPDLMFTSGGKYNLDVYLSRVLHLDEATFRDFVSQTDTLNFLPWSENSDAILCTAPLYPKTSVSLRRTCLFRIPYAKMLESFEPVMGEGLHQLGAVFSSDGQLIYLNRSCPIPSEELLQAAADGQMRQYGDHACFVSGLNNGYSTIIFVPVSAYARSAIAFENSLRIIIAVNIFISLAIAAALTWLNYRPVRNLMNGIGLRISGEKNEFEAIKDAYDSREKKVVELERENDENRALLRGHLIEKLLDGGSLSPEESPILENVFGADGCFFAAIARMDDVARPSALEHAPLAQRGAFLFEMRRDGYLAFLCRIETPAERTALAQWVQRAVGASLGVGSVGVGWRTLHTSYLEAILAFDKGLSVPVVFYERAQHTASADGDDRSMELMQLARALKNGDESALDQMDALFDDVVRNTPASLFFQRYACYHLVESLRRILAKMEIPMSSERAAQILGQNSMSDIRAACMDELRRSLKQIRQSASEQRASLSAQMQAMAESEFTRCEFGLDSLAEAFNMTEYSASRIFKESMGISFKKYITCMRIERAKELLHDTNLSVADISSRVGFASCSYFIRVFKAEEGLSPTAYRQNRFRP